MKQRVLVSASAVALVALAAGGAALAARGNSSHTPRTLTVVQGSGGGAAAEAKLSADTASGFARPYQDMIFVLSGDLPVLDGDRPVWHLAANPTADIGAIAALAKSLGLEGDVQTVEGGWQVGDPQSGETAVFVNKAPGLPWYFSNYSEMKPGYACASAAGGTPEGDVALVPTTMPPECEPPPPPTGILTQDEALAKTGDLLTALGFDAGSFALTAYTSEWSADVQAVPSLDGIATPSLTMSFGFGGEGKLQYANGFLLVPEKADSYPRMGTTKAFDALKAGNGIMGWFGYGGPMMRNSIGFDTGAPATTASGEVASNSASGSEMVCAVDAPLDPTIDTTTTIPVCAPPVPCLMPAPVPAGEGDKAIATSYACGPTECGGSTDITTDPPAPVPLCPDPLPTEPTTPPEPVTITITGVHETLVPLWDADGSMWLVPGYEFTSADGGTWPTLAIDQSFVDQVAPDGPVPETAVVGTAPAPEPAVDPATSAAGG